MPVGDVVPKACQCSQAALAASESLHSVLIDIPGQLRRSFALVDAAARIIRDASEGAEVEFVLGGLHASQPTLTLAPQLTRVLVDLLQAWVDDNELVAAETLLFRTRNGTRPSTPNWRRAWHRALDKVGHPPLRVYDCRHAAATTWLRAGVPLGETARQMGHGVETLVSTYVGALEGDEAIGNARVDAELDGHVTG